MENILQQGSLRRGMRNTSSRRKSMTNQDQKKTPGSKCSDLGDKFMIIDNFGEQLFFTIPGDRTRYKSLLGSILTILVAVISLGYALARVSRLFVDSESAIKWIEQDKVYDNTFEMNATSGFNIGIALFSQANFTLEVFDQSYGSLKMYRNQYDSEDFSSTELSLSICDESAFALHSDGDQAGKFFPLQESFRDYDAFIRKRLYCP